jgi:hypothetical protein
MLSIQKGNLITAEHIIGYVVKGTRTMYNCVLFQNVSGTHRQEGKQSKTSFKRERKFTCGNLRLYRSNESQARASL